MAKPVVTLYDYIYLDVDHMNVWGVELDLIYLPGRTTHFEVSQILVFRRLTNHKVPRLVIVSKFSHIPISMIIK